MVIWKIYFIYLFPRLKKKSFICSGFEDFFFKEKEKHFIYISLNVINSGKKYFIRFLCNYTYMHINYKLIGNFNRDGDKIKIVS